MMKLFALCLLLFSSASGFAQNTNFEIIVQPDKPAKLRKYSEMDNKKVLVTDTIVPPGTIIHSDIDHPLLYQWVLNDRGQIFQTSMPYYRSKVIKLPDDFPLDPNEKERILRSEFPVNVMDLNPALIVSTLYPQNLPSGVDKIDVLLPWEAFNPKGTWAYAIQKAMANPSNEWLVNNPPRDVVDFCPRYSGLAEKEKTNFWALLISHISDWESRFVPLTASDEGIFDPSKRGVISSGLTQISLRSAQASCYQARGCNAIKNQTDLFDPAKNLQCAVGVMSCLSENASCLSCKQNGRWKGIAQYWSTLQTAREVPCSICPGGKAFIGKKLEIQTSLKTSAPFCF